MRPRFICFSILALMLPLASHAENQPFQQGQFSLGLGGGGGPGGFGLGLNVGYMALDGLEVSLGGSYWVFDETNLIRITPGVRYIFVTGGSLMPYGGVFGRRWFFTDDAYDDITSLGGRGGTYIRAGRNALLAIGVAYEHILDCPSGLDEQCSEIYPEFGLSILF
ncbi:MAG: hypothetical protein VX589_16095 [Myxococcota bacterium]|nr:hypothetical protein [Myxococcota bacterium]